MLSDASATKDFRTHYFKGEIALFSLHSFIHKDFWLYKSSYYDTLGVVVLCLHRPKTLTLPHEPKIIQYIQMKLGTRLPRDNTHAYTKSHLLLLQ